MGRAERISVIGLFVLAVGYTLFVVHELFVPVVTAWVRARDRADDPAPACQRPPDRGVRLRRRSRSRQAAADGRDRRPPRRPRHRHRRQSAQRGSRRRSAPRSSPPARGAARSATAPRRSTPRSPSLPPATCWSSPARAMRHTRSSATGRCRSTMHRSRAPLSPPGTAARRRRPALMPPAEALPVLWTSDEAAAATDGHATRDWHAVGVSIDSRTREAERAVRRAPRSQLRRPRLRRRRPQGRRSRGAGPSRARRISARDAPLLVVDDTHARRWRRSARPPRQRSTRDVPRRHRQRRQDRHQGDAARSRSAPAAPPTPAPAT